MRTVSGRRAAGALVALGTALLLPACGGVQVDPNAPLPTTREEARNVSFVDAGTLHAWIDAGHRGDVVFIDNRDPFAFEQQHIEGARVVPTDKIEDALPALPLNKYLIFYCT